MKTYTFCSDTEESLKKYYPWRADFIMFNFDKIQSYINEKNIELSIYTKEKYWRYDLTINWPADDYIRDIVNHIELKTPHICIETWEELDEMYWWENRRDLWWVLPLCDKCFNEKMKAKKDLVWK